MFGKHYKDEPTDLGITATKKTAFAGKATISYSQSLPENAPKLDPVCGEGQYTLFQDKNGKCSWVRDVILDAETGNAYAYDEQTLSVFGQLDKNDPPKATMFQAVMKLFFGDKRASSQQATCNNSNSL